MIDAYIRFAFCDLGGIWEYQNIFVVCNETYFLDSGSPRGEGGFVHAWAWFVIIG